MNNSREWSKKMINNSGNVEGYLLVRYGLHFQKIYLIFWKSGNWGLRYLEVFLKCVEVEKYIKVKI